ncbi:MAG: T9SS type A sorting domain-containing protein [Bacteroidetes bacterium]|nr:T9SS type A sorting domain-containing protein [Bacteroidota bacterium]
MVASNACGNSNARTKTVYGKPAKPKVINGPNLFCLNDTVTFSTSAIFGITNYTWTVPSGLSILSGQGTTSITVKGGNNVTSGDVCVKAGNSCGTTGTFCLSVNAYPSPNSIGSITGSTNGLCGTTKNYSVTNQSGITFNWTTPTGTTINSGQGTNKISVTFSNSFVTGDIIVTASSPCGTTVTAFKTVNGAPVSPSSITGATTVCFNQVNVPYSCTSVTGATSYFWTIPVGATLMSGQGTQNIVLNYNGTAGTQISLKVRAVNNCGQSTNRSVNINLQACPREGLNNWKDINLYPNPASDEVTISWYNVYEEKVVISCIDILGQVVLTQSIQSGSGEQQYTVNTSGLADGVYIVKVMRGDGVVGSRRLIINK